MKRLCVGLLLLTALLTASAVFAEPCGLCQAYYPCSWSCQHCVEGRGGPGYWVIDGGYCWGDIVEGTCGDIGQCQGGGGLGMASLSTCAPFFEPMGASQASVPAAPAASF